MTSGRQLQEERAARVMGSIVKFGDWEWPSIPNPAIVRYML